MGAGREGASYRTAVAGLRTGAEHSLEGSARDGLNMAKPTRSTERGPIDFVVRHHLKGELTWAGLPYPYMERSLGKIFDPFLCPHERGGANPTGRPPEAVEPELLNAQEPVVESGAERSGRIPDGSVFNFRQDGIFKPGKVAREECMGGSEARRQMAQVGNPPGEDGVEEGGGKRDGVEVRRGGRRGRRGSGKGRLTGECAQLRVLTRKERLGFCSFGRSCHQWMGGEMLTIVPAFPLSCILSLLSPFSLSSPSVVFHVLRAVASPGGIRIPEHEIGRIDTSPLA